MAASLKSNDQRCGTCKYRGGDIMKFDPDAGDYGDDVPTGYFLCERIKHINARYGHYEKGLKAGVEDGSGYRAALCVEDDFGCVLWEPK